MQQYSHNNFGVSPTGRNFELFFTMAAKNSEKSLDVSGIASPFLLPGRAK